MNVHLARNGGIVGVYEYETIDALIKSGQILLTDSYWVEGMVGWEPIAKRWRSTTSPSGMEVRLAPAGLLPCPSCADNVSPEAAACPHCGHPLKPGLMGRRGTDRVLNVGCLVVILIAILLISLFIGLSR